MLTRTTFLLCAATFLLSACSEQREMIREKYTGERYGAPVQGPRRPPELNPDGLRLTTKVPAKITPNATPAMPPKVVAPQVAAESGDAPVKKPFGGVSSPAPVSNTGPVRKPFRGLSVAPVEEPPVFASPEAAAEAIVASPAPVSTPDEPTPLVGTLPRSVSEEENGVVVPEVPVRKAKAKGGEPHLSSVPKAPPQFKELKKTKLGTERELQMNFDAAQEQKRMLSEEPTELTPSEAPVAPAASEEPGI